MAQHDYSIANQTFPNTRLDLNNSLSAIVSNNSGATEPSTTYAYQWWYDETTDTLKMRNSDNDAWITMFTFDQTADTYSLATDVELTITENLDLTGSATISGDLTVDTDTLKVDTTNNRVGVKNASPTVELDVVGDVKVAGNLSVDGGTIKLDGNYPTGTANVALGDGALDDGSLTGINNTALGNSALTANTTASSNTAVGSLALASNQDGNDNTAIGREALTSNVSGDANVAVGREALEANTASNNTAVGYQSGNATTTGNSNVSLGYQSLLSNTTASDNTALGYISLQDNTTGNNLVAVGAGALADNTTGLQSVAVGRSALRLNTTGNYNVCLGYDSGGSITTGSDNVTVGTSSGAQGAMINITTASNRGVFGNNNITNAYVKVAWTVTSDARDKMNISTVPHGLGFVNQLNPVSFNFKKDRDTEIPHGNKRYGFLAQDILALEGEDNVIIDNEFPDSLKYQGEALVPVLVNAIKELSAKVDALQEEVNTLKGA